MKNIKTYKLFLENKSFNYIMNALEDYKPSYQFIDSNIDADDDSFFVEYVLDIDTYEEVSKELNANYDLFAEDFDTFCDENELNCNGIYINDGNKTITYTINDDDNKR